MITLAIILLLAGNPGDTPGDATDLCAQAVTFVKEQATAAGLDVLVACGHVPGSFQLPAGHPTISFDPIDREKLRGSTAVVAHIAVDDRSVTKVMIPVTIRVFAEVPVTSRRMEKHDLLTAGDLTLQKKETTYLRDEIFTPQQAVVYRMKQMIAPGAVLYSRMVEENPLVGQGETITLLAKNGGVTLSTKAIAREDGWEGSTIIVQKAGTHDRLRAKVTGAKTAVVKE